MSQIQDNILTVTGIQLRGADRQKHLQQMVTAIGRLDDDGWKRLSPAAQQWYDDLFGDKDELDKRAEIKDFTEAGPAVAAKPKSLKEDQVAKSTNKHNGKRKNAGSAKAGKTEGAPVLIRRMLNKNPKLSATELHDKLKQRGNSASKFTVAATRSIHIATLRELKKDGFLKGIPI